jgi:hypothetical protein
MIIVINSSNKVAFGFKVILFEKSTAAINGKGVIGYETQNVDGGQG